MEYTVKDKQSLFDIAIQELGGASLVTEIALANNISITEDLEVGSVINIPESVSKRNEVINYFTKRKITLSTDTPRPNRSQTITFPAVPTDLGIGQTYALNATATSGLPITYVSSNSAVASISNSNILTIHDFGTISIIANQEGNSVYFSATATQTLIITNNFEIEAQMFFDAGVALGESALSTSIKEAVNSHFFKGGKEDGWYSKIKVGYLYVGGTAVWHSINAVDPGDYQSTFGGSPTQDTNGITFSGVGQWQDTNFARNLLDVNNLSIGFYSRTTGTTGYCMGIEDTSVANKSVWIASRLVADRFQVNYGNWIDDVTETDGKGFYSFSAIASGGSNTAITQFKNGASVASTTIANSNISLSNLDIFVGALNSNGAANYYSNRNMAFSFIAEGLTNAEMSNLYTRVQALQTALSRAV